MNRIDSTRKNHLGTTTDPPDIIIEGGTLITMAEGQAPISKVRISIKKDKIIDIQTYDDRYQHPAGAEIIDARNGIIMPGLVNTHSHTAMTIFRGLADDLPLKQWLYDKIFPAPGVDDPANNLKVGEEFIKKWLGFSDRITPGLFCHSPVTCSDKTLQRAMEISRDHSLPLQIHLSETMEEVDEIVDRKGQRPVHYLNRLGLLGEDLIADHAIHLNDEEMDLLSQNGVRIVHVPESNMKLSSGVARVSDMVKMGLTVGLGTDGCASNNNLDLFQEMDTAAKIGKVFTHDPVNMDAETVLKMATSWGGEILGLEREIGSIEVGKKADIIVVDIQSPHLVPLYNPTSTIVYSANGADVKDVIVNGQILMKDRNFRTLDPEEIIERVTAISREIMP
jgi:5-methylthioadenosine/S-adenosylhomocysteine deaminase